MKKIMLFWCLIFSCVFQVSAEVWKGPYSYNNIQSDFVAGYDQKNDPLFIGLIHSGESNLNALVVEKGGYVALRGQKTPSDGQWVVGMLAEKFRGLIYTHKDKVMHSKHFLVFAPDKPSNYEWRAGEDGSIPAGALRLWRGGEARYICRAKWRKGIFPGTLDVAQKSCFITFGGKTRRLFVYEVLIETASL